MRNVCRVNQMTTIKQKTWLLLIAGIGCAVLLVVVCVSVNDHFLSSPEGVFYDRGLACSEGYWVLEGGKIYIRADGSNYLMNTYIKSGDAWVYGKPSTNAQTILEPSLFGLKMVDPANHKNEVFIPRRGFAWIFKLSRGK